MGGRSSLTTKMLQDIGMENISHLDTGFGGWIEDGEEIQTYDDWKAAKKAK